MEWNAFIFVQVYKALARGGDQGLSVLCACVLGVLGGGAARVGAFIPPRDHHTHTQPMARRACASTCSRRRCRPPAVSLWRR